MKQSLLNADFKSALNIMNEKRFRNSELDKGRRKNLFELAVLAIWSIILSGEMAIMAYVFSRVVGIYAWICWGLFVFPCMVAIVAKFIRHKDYGSYFFYKSLTEIMVCICWDIVLIMISVYLVRENMAKWEPVFQTVIVLICLIFDIPHNIKKLRHELAGKNEKSIYYTDIIFGIVFVALLIYNFKLSTILSENSFKEMLEALIENVVFKQGILVNAYLMFDKLLLYYAKNYFLVSWYAKKYPEETRKHFNIPITKWYYSNELREKHGADFADMTVIEKLEKAKVDDYEFYKNDIARINDVDMRGETVIAGFDIAIGSKDVYLICTDKKMYPVYKDNTFNMSVPQISYESLKWYDTDKKNYFRISDGKLIILFHSIKNKKRQVLESILAEHGIPKLDWTLSEVPKHAEIKKDGIPSEFVENYQAALSSFSEDEEEIGSDKVEHDVIVDSTGVYFLVTNKRFIFVFGNDDFHIPYTSVDYSELSVYKQHYFLADNLCLRDKNDLFMPFSGTSETWKRITTKYLVDLINQSQKDALKGGVMSMMNADRKDDVKAFVSFEQMRRQEAP